MTGLGLKEAKRLTDIASVRFEVSGGKAQELAKGLPNDVEKARCLFQWVRDEIPHSKDIGADVVIMLHPDGQYDPSFIPQIVKPIRQDQADMVLGSRLLIKGSALGGGMPLYKFISNRILTTIENLILGKRFSELHTGYRAYSRRFLERVPFLRNSNDFVFDSQIIAQAIAFGMRVEEVPVTTKYFKEASSVNFKVSLIYGFKTLWTMFRFFLHKNRLLKCRLFNP